MSKHLLCFSVGWLAFALSVLAQTSVLDQRVTVHQRNATIQEVLAELSEKYKISFSYSSNLVPVQKKVNLQTGQRPLRHVLDELLRGTNTNYSLIGGQIILQPAKQLPGKKEKEWYTISGYVIDEASGEALAGATITEGVTGTSSNAYGFYSLQTTAGQPQLQIRYLGYTPLQIQLAPITQDTVIIWKLQANANQLSEVAVTAEKITDLQQANRLSMRSHEIKQLPRFMGEADAIKALQLMPGVQEGREGSSDLIVRGGSPDQNLILLDGVPVYNVSHLLGTFSVFNPDAIKNVDLIKGGFPAPYGGRLSSVIDVQLKEGNNKHFAGEGAVGLISSKLLLEGPIKNDKTSFLIAGRRTYLDLLAMAAAAMSGESIPHYNFGDLNAKVNHTFSAKDRIYLSLYGGQDKFNDNYSFERLAESEEQKFNMRWGNTTGALRWNHVYGPRLFSNITLIHSRYSFRQVSEVERKQVDNTTSRTTNYSSSIKDWGAKADFDFAATNRHKIRFGTSYTYHNFRPESVLLQTDTLTLTSDSFSKIIAHEFYTYADDQIQLSERLQAILGLHFSGFTVNGRTFTSLQPRLGLGYTSPKGFSIRGSFATMAQYMHLLSNTSTGTPTDVWAPSTDKVKPQRSWQATLGAAALLKQDQLELTSDLYYKEMKDIAEFKDGADFITDFMRSGPKTNFANFVAPPYETRIVSGRGWTYGSEWMLRKRQGKTTGWVSYTLAWSWRQLDSINFNQKYPYTYDSRHSGSVVINHQFNEKWSIGGSWIYRTGYMTTLPLTRYKAYNEYKDPPGSSSSYIANVDHVGERNNYRMPSYHRLDLSLTHTKKKKWGERYWNLSVYNAYNRQNPYFLQLSENSRESTGNDGSSSSRTRYLYQTSLLPILPSFSYGFKF
ncbi:TonB-dependent receptor [Pontibacter cellulosilyticus]|uniref:TonB-dependent receptor plug domain-containing protein n=1 Tax=Pontibacter cellulosilyticus TaxID=1720253 RepID=A0A923N6F7_9BACT|nr:TonB-dependent receptor [Pontibacter cellulosilyticus]MBC5993523.1 TonB-dependent receptor plug domain-containing protein [Pontibacter cellulosilyticus]